MRRRTGTRRGAFTLVELVMVVMIIGMVASMAIPRMSRGAVAASNSALVGNLTIVRTAILRYTVEHRNQLPGSTAAKVAAQLTQYSDPGGETSPTRTAQMFCGPYLWNIPPCPTGFNPSSSEILIDAVNSPPKGKAASTAGWVYNPNTGEFYPNDSDENIIKLHNVQAVAP